GTSWLYALTGGNTGPVTAAEGFVFLSGLVLGMVSRRRVVRDGLRAAIWATVLRARTLYLLSVVLTLAFVGLTVGTNLALWVDRALLDDIPSWPALIGSILAFRFTWNGTDILVLYTLLLSAAPLAILLLARGHAWHLLGLSWTLWLAYQVAPDQAVLPWHIEHATTFPFTAWQALFVTALTLGYHREGLAAWVERLAHRPSGPGMAYRLGLGVAACALVLLGVVLTVEQAHATTGTIPAMTALNLFDKPSLGVGRLAAFASTALLIYLGLTLCWRPIERAIGWLLIPLGQASLYAYAVHLFFILAAYNVPPYVGVVEPGWELHNTLGQMALVLLLWVMVKRRVLFQVIPR
ncbi:MAG: OpgC domain-containing protein, partial [Chloroflexota bacterium]